MIDASYWIVVDEIPRGELLLGLSMWNEEVERGRLTHERFERPASGAVNVGWGFEVALGPHQCRAVTRTRTSPSGERARRRFRAYWPPSKIAGRWLAPYLALSHDELKAPPGVAVDTDLTALKWRAMIGRDRDGQPAAVVVDADY